MIQFYYQPHNDEEVQTLAFKRFPRVIKSGNLTSITVLLLVEQEICTCHSVNETK